MRVKINTDAVKNAVKNIDRNFSNMQTGISNIDTEFDEIGNLWSGSDSLSFQHAALDFMTELPQLQDCLDSCIESINNYISKVEKLDSEYASNSINLI